MSARQCALGQWAVITASLLLGTAIAIQGDWLRQIDQALLALAQNLWAREPAAGVVTVASNPAHTVLALLAVLAPLLGCLLLESRRALLLALGASAALLVGAALALRAFSFWFPPAAPALAALLAFPLWRWRRLEAAQRDLERELARLRDEPEPLRALASSDARNIPPEAEPDRRRVELVRGALARLRDARRFTCDTLAGLPHAALIAGTDARVVLANRRAVELLGAAGSESIAGADLRALLAPLRTDPAGACDELLAGARPAVQARTKEAREFLVTAAPLHGDDQARVATIVSLVETSDLSAARSQRDQTLSFLSHDMRGPQVSILSLLELAQLAPEDAPANMLEHIEDHARRTLGLADDFVLLARAGNQHARPLAATDLGDTLRAAAEDIGVQARRKAIEIALEIPQNIPVVVDGEQRSLARAFANVLSNAIKRSPERTGVICRLTPGPERHEVLISDQGPTLGAEELARLFDAPTRTNEHERRGAPRTSLGQALVTSVLARHGATVEVRSAPDEGATLRISFAARRADATDLDLQVGGARLFPRR